MKIIGINDWTLGASCLEHAESNRQELLEATLKVMHDFGCTLKNVEWFGSVSDKSDIYITEKSA